MKDYSKEELEAFIREQSDEKYRNFHERLTKSRYRLNGIPIPVLRKYAKDLVGSSNLSEFFKEKSWCYECCMLKGLTLSKLKTDDEEFFKLLDGYISEIDDWALNDMACCAIHRKDEKYLAKVKSLAKSEDVWQARWGIVAVMTNFFDKDAVIRDLVDDMAAEDYYVDMALAWLIQVLCVKNRRMAIELLQSPKVSADVKKYAKRKIKDSFRISDEDKIYFCSLIA